MTLYTMVLDPQKKRKKVQQTQQTHTTVVFTLIPPGLLVKHCDMTDIYFHS